MNFTIDTYDRGRLEGMIGLYNSETAFEPHIAPLTADMFIQLVEAKSYFDPAGLFVAHDGGRVVGWIHACSAPGSEPHHKPEDLRHRIHMLIYSKDELAVGRALVAEATQWLKSRGAASVEALHARFGYPFYRGLWAGGEPMGPSGMPHVQLALEVGGYKNTQESILMTAPMPATPVPVTPDASVELIDKPVAMVHEPMRQSWTGFNPMYTQAMLGGEAVGTIGWVVIPYVTRLGAPALNIWTLGVKEALRRKGIAAALISRAMSQAYAQGARSCSVGTQLWNAPAHAAYAKFGYRPHMVLVGRSADFSTAT